jgi:hypothetical protein
MNLQYSVRIMDNLLHQFKIRGVSAIICGGFVRDTLLYNANMLTSNGFNDIDVYVNSKDYNGIEDFKLKFKDLPYFEVLQGIDKSLYTDHDSDIVEIFETRCPKSHNRVQVIIINTDKNITQYIQDKFDLSINMVAYDGFNFFKSPAFLKTLETKVIRVNPNVDVEKLISKGRIKKMGLRFYDFKIEGLTRSDFYYKSEYKFVYRNKLNDILYSDYLKGDSQSFFINERLLVI